MAGRSIDDHICELEVAFTQNRCVGRDVWPPSCWAFWPLGDSQELAALCGSFVQGLGGGRRLCGGPHIEEAGVPDVRYLVCALALDPMFQRYLSTVTFPSSGPCAFAEDIG